LLAIEHQEVPIGKASLIVVVCPEEDGNEGQPHDAGRVHREPDVLCLVEVFRNFPAQQKNKESVAVSVSRRTAQV